MTTELKIVFFAPHSAIWVHAFPEALVAEALKQHGHDLRYISCGEVFERHCVPMSAHRLTHNAAASDKAAVCRLCHENKRLIRKEFGFDGYDIATVLTTEDFQQANRIMSDATPENFLDIVRDGVEIGRSALSTFLLSYKRISLQFNNSEWECFSTELYNTILSFLACRKVLDRERPDRIILYSSGYSVNLVWCLLAESRGIPFYYMNAGSNLSDRLQKVVLARGHSLQRRLLNHWDRFKDIPCSLSTMTYITDHVLELLKGQHSFVYSVPKSQEPLDIRERFSIRQDQKILVAAMSSYDELFAAQITGLFPSDFPVLFPSQIEWVRALFEYVRRRPDLFLIVRVHPREFPNKRDLVKSEHARQIEEVVADLPLNARVNWPTDNISLYDLAEVTDVCLNSWSTVGKELSLLGIPVVIYSPDLVFYPSDLNYFGTTSDMYFVQIESALKDGWNHERIRLTYRWLALEDRYSRLDISDSYTYKEHARRPIWQRVIGRIQRELSPQFQQRSDCKHRASQLTAASVINRIVTEGRDSVLDLVDTGQLERVSDEVETRALKMQVGRLASALYAGRTSSPVPGTLRQHLFEFVHS